MKSVKLFRILQVAVGELNALACRVRDDDDGDTEEQRKEALERTRRLVEELTE